MGVLHRDLKPENLVFDFRGYLKLTDFGIARFARSDNSGDTSGTAGYISPEVLCHHNHGPAADFFALGIICFEMLLGYRPYSGRSRREVKDQILARQVKVKQRDLSYNTMSNEGIEFINSLIQRKPQNRLGYGGGTKELKAHSWLAEFPWNELSKGIVRPPYSPNYIERDVGYGERTDPDETVLVEQACPPRSSAEDGSLLLNPRVFC